MTEDDGYETIVPDMKCGAVAANLYVPSPNPSEIWDAAYNQALKDAAALSEGMDDRRRRSISSAILSLGDKGNG